MFNPPAADEVLIPRSFGMFKIFLLIPRRLRRGDSLANCGSRFASSFKDIQNRDNTSPHHSTVAIPYISNNSSISSWI